MLIKNVTPRIITLMDFLDERPVHPGAVVDLSKYSVGERQQSAQLQSLFTKGDFICLGFAPTSPALRNKVVQKTSLTKQQFQAETLHQGEIIIPPRSLKPQVAPLIQKELYPAKTTVTPERYNTEALAQYNHQLADIQEHNPPPFQEKLSDHADQSHSFVQIQDENEVTTYAIDEATGTVFAQPETQPGLVVRDHTKDPSVFVDGHNYQEDKVRSENRAKLKAQIQQKVHQKIVALVNERCLAAKRDGTSCQRLKLAHYEQCFEHLTPPERQRYLSDKSSGNSDSR